MHSSADCAIGDLAEVFLDSSRDVYTMLKPYGAPCSRPDSSWPASDVIACSREFGSLHIVIYLVGDVLPAEQCSAHPVHHAAPPDGGLRKPVRRPEIRRAGPPQSPLGGAVPPAVRLAAPPFRPPRLGRAVGRLPAVRADIKTALSGGARRSRLPRRTGHGLVDEPASGLPDHGSDAGQAAAPGPEAAGEYGRGGAGRLAAGHAVSQARQSRQDDPPAVRPGGLRQPVEPDDPARPEAPGCPAAGPGLVPALRRRATVSAREA